MKKFFSALIFFVLSTGLYASIYTRPRKVYVLPTEYFDIMFPRGAERTASKIAENVDSYFKEAAESFGLDYEFRLPIVVSLDSDTYSISYTSSPYNRILIFNSPDDGYFADDAFLSKLRKEIFSAVAANVKSPFWQKLHKIISQDAWQPVTLLNIPSSFLEGAVNASSQVNNDGILGDGFSLRILVTAKTEGTFPDWRDAVGSRDIYPKDISVAAYSAFASYIQSRWGMKKFGEFWKESGSLKFFKITAGNFKKVYGVSLDSAWNDFVDAIPYDRNPMEGEIVFREEGEGYYSDLINSSEGIYYVSSSKGTVNLLTENKKRKSVVFALDVDNLSISSDEKFMAVSYSGKKRNEVLGKNIVQIFDLVHKLYIPGNYNLRKGTFVRTKVDENAIAGFSVHEFNVNLQIYAFDEEVLSNCIYNLTLPDGIQTGDIISYGVGKLFCTFYKDRHTYIQQLNFLTGESRFIELPFFAKHFKIGTFKNAPCVSFTYSNKGSNAVGFFLPDDEGNFNNVFLQQNNIYAGINDALVCNDLVYYVSKLSRVEEFKRIPVKHLVFIQQPVYEKDMQMTLNFKNDFYVKSSKGEKYLGDYKLERYKPFNYIFKGSWLPLFPVSSMDFTSVNLSPGLGATYYTSSDPVDSVSGILSFCTGYIDLSEDTIVVDDDFSTAANFNISILPCPVSVGGIWSFKKDGSYNLNALVGVTWKIETGWPNHNLSFGLKELWNSTTTFLDYETEKTVSLTGWPSIGRAYNIFSTSFNMNYSNYRQWGRSAFEQIGVEFSSSLVYIYDPQKTDKKSDDDYDTSQVTGSFEFGLKLPYIVPVFGVDEWVLSFPLYCKTEWFKENGVASNNFVETLLFGYEVQRGIPGVNLYLHRFGVKFGYDFKYSYNQFTTEDTDFRMIENFGKAILESKLDDYYYFDIIFDVSPGFGRFAENKKISAGLQFQMDLRNRVGKIQSLISLKI